jgi:OOP family OmpA-OmpF porin
MTHQSAGFRSATPRHISLAAALVLTLLPLANAAAQDLPRVRVTNGDTTIRAMRYSMSDVWRLTRAESGTVFEVLSIDGDQARFLESNYYLVLLPRDAWGTQWVGWISGRNLEQAAPRPPASASRPAASPAAGAVTVMADAPTPGRAPAPSTTSSTTSLMPSPTPTTAATAPRSMPDVVLQFAFDRSDLAEVAKYNLTTALSTMTTGGDSVSFAIGGHADATGPDVYNQKLGLARADAVRKYMVDDLKVPADRISVSSYGETRPVASNATSDGRAENRRVVLTVTAASSLR